jgi:hypothetical protein
LLAEHFLPEVLVIAQDPAGPRLPTLGHAASLARTRDDHQRIRKGRSASLGRATSSTEAERGASIGQAKTRLTWGMGRRQEVQSVMRRVQGAPAWTEQATEDLASGGGIRRVTSNVSNGDP